MSNTQSLNYNIVGEFEKLVNFVQLEIDQAKENKNQKEATANTFRLKQIKNALATIKKFPKQLSKDNLDDFAELPGIGKGTIDRIKEILDSGKLDELKNFKDKGSKEKKILEELESIVGIGRSTALYLISQGIKSVDQLKKKIASKKVRSMRLIFENSTKSQNVLISGFELEVVTPYKPTLKE